MSAEAEIGRYVLLERIGVGGMAEVFRAVQRGAAGFERPVAIKRILPHLAEDLDFVRMFVDEAKIAVQLQHPNIVQVLDLGREDREYFIVMEYVHGKDLRAIQDRAAQLGREVPLAVAVHVVTKVCEALQHAHAAQGHGGRPLGVVHRDVTPQNVLVSFDGEVKVADFGLARAAGRATRTQAGVIKGKLAYMAPEAFLGLAVDHRSDVFAAGVLLWELVAGRRLFLGHNDLDTALRVRDGVVPPLRTIDPTLPEELDRIVLRALARDREERHQSAEELGSELVAFAYGHRRYLSSTALAAWLREIVPPEPERGARHPDVETREIRLDDIERPSGPRLRPARPAPPPAPEHRDPYGASAFDAAGDVRPIDVEELLEDDAAGDTLRPPAAEGFDAPAAEGFDETTSHFVPAALATEPRYDEDLVSTTVPRVPAAPTAPGAITGLGWDESEDATRAPPRRR